MNTRHDEMAQVAVGVTRWAELRAQGYVAVGWIDDERPSSDVDPGTAERLARFRISAVRA